MTYVVATDQCCSVRDFCFLVYSKLGYTQLRWSGTGLDEKLIGRFGDSDIHQETTLVEIDQAFFRPGEVPYLRGDATKIQRELGWQASTSFDELVAEMIDYNQQLISSSQATISHPRAKL